MHIKKYDYLLEVPLFVALFGLTFSNAMVENSIGFMVIIVLYRLFKTPKELFPRGWISILLAIFTAIVIITMLRSAYLFDSFKGVLRTFKYFILFFYAYWLISTRKGVIVRMFWGIIFISTLTYINGIFQYFTGFDFMRFKRITEGEALHRISAAFAHPNDFGGYILVSLPFTLLLLAPGMSRKKRVFLALCGILGFFCLLQTSSRSAWGAIMVGLIFFMYFYKRKLVLLVPILLIAGIIAHPLGWERLTNVMNYFLHGEENTVWERIQIWKGAWAMIREHPLLGMGINTFSDYFPRYKPAGYPDLRYAHNCYLQMWAEIGLIGLLCYLSILVNTLMLGIKKIRQMKDPARKYFLAALVSAFIGFAIQAGMDTNFYSLVLNTYFWIIIAAIHVIARSREEGRLDL